VLELARKRLEPPVYWAAYPIDLADGRIKSASERTAGKKPATLSAPTDAHMKPATAANATDCPIWSLSGRRLATLSAGSSGDLVGAALLQRHSFANDGSLGK